MNKSLPADDDKPAARFRRALSGDYSRERDRSGTVRDRPSFDRSNAGRSPSSSDLSKSGKSTPTSINASLSGSSRPSMRQLARSKSLHTIIQEKQEEEEEDGENYDFLSVFETEHPFHGLRPGDYRHRLIMNPSEPWRVSWDLVMLGMIVYVMIVAPFELTFVSDRTYNNSSNLTLFCFNRFVDFLFVVDFVMQFFTSYYEEEKGKWVTSLHDIAWTYARSWFLIDFISIFPWWCLDVEQGSFFRLVRLARLFKLLRVVKSPRIVARVMKHLTISTRSQTVCMYITLLLFTIHLSACGLRLITGLAIDWKGAERCYARADSPNLQAFHEFGPDEECPNTYLTHANTWSDGIWAQYTSAIIWSFTAMNGEATFVNHAEGVLGFVMMLVGCIMIAFLLGDLANVMSNMDPVKNLHKQTLDSLNDYMQANKYPRELRIRLREYVMLSEPVFRYNYYNQLLDRLSPSLQALVARQDYGKIIEKIPFFAYACTKFYDINPGDIVRARAPRRKGNDFDWTNRRALVVAVTRDLTYNLKYLDLEGAPVETNVKFSRLQLDEYLLGEGAYQISISERVQQLPFQKNLIMFKIARLLRLELRMERDEVIRANVSINDVLYAVKSGAVLLFGHDPFRPYAIKRCGPIDRNPNNVPFFGDDIAMLISGTSDKPNKFILRRYSAHCTRITQLYTLQALDFHSIIIDKNQFPTFRKYVARYGIWTRLRYDILDVVKTQREDRRRRAGAYTAPNASHQKFFDASIAAAPCSPKGRDPFALMQGAVDRVGKAMEGGVKKSSELTSTGARRTWRAARDVVTVASTAGARRVDRSASAPSVVVPPPPPPRPDDAFEEGGDGNV